MWSDKAIQQIYPHDSLQGTNAVGWTWKTDPAAPSRACSEKAQIQQHSLLLTSCKQNLLHIVISESLREAAPQFQFQTWASQALHTQCAHLLSQSPALSRVYIRWRSGILSSLYYSYDHKRAGVRKLLRKNKKTHSSPHTSHRQCQLPTPAAETEPTLPKPTASGNELKTTGSVCLLDLKGLPENINFYLSPGKTHT